jgi:hypothetical protein
VMDPTGLETGYFVSSTVVCPEAMLTSDNTEQNTVADIRIC